MSAVLGMPALLLLLLVHMRRMLFCVWCGGLGVQFMLNGCAVHDEDRNVGSWRLTGLVAGGPSKGLKRCYNASNSSSAYDLGGCMRHACCWCGFLRFCLLVSGVCCRTWLGKVAVVTFIGGAGSIKATWSFACQLGGSQWQSKAEGFARLKLVTAAW